MRLTLLIYHLYLPACHSLKEKRSVIKGLKEKIRNRFRISVAEIDHQDKWQRSKIAIAWVSADGSQIEKTIASIDDLVASRSELQVLRVEHEDLK